MSGGFNTDAIRQANSPLSVADRLGLNVKRVRKKLQCSCPGCGKARFAIDEKDGWFNCFHACDFKGGDVIRLVELVLNKSFPEACDWLGGGEGLSPEDEAKIKAEAERRAKQAEDEERARLTKLGKQMRKLMSGLVDVTPDTPVWDYLTARKLEPGMIHLGWDKTPPEWIKCHPDLVAGCAPKDEKWRELGRFPAMVGIFRTHDSKTVMLHRTFIDSAAKAVPENMSEGEADAWNAKQMMGSAALSDAGLYLGRIGDPADEALPAIVAEGIESTLALACSGAEGDYYVAGSLDKLRLDSPGAWRAPAGQAVVIGADNDLSPTPLQPCGARRAADAFDQAARRLRRAGHAVRVAMPPPGLDWNDVVCGREPVLCSCSRCLSLRGSDSAATPQADDQGHRPEGATVSAADNETPKSQTEVVA